MKRSIVPAVLMYLSAVAMADPVRLSQTGSDEVVFGSGVGCTIGGLPGVSLDYSMWRSFTLSDHGITSDVVVSSVEVGVEMVQLPTLGEAPLTVNLYTAPPHSEPTLGLTLIGSATELVGDTLVERIPIAIEATAPGGTALVVEISFPNCLDLAGVEAGDLFISGSNRSGESKPTYVHSISCGVLEPDPYWDGCFCDPPFYQVVVVIGNTICQADLDGDGELTLFDFLTFQNLFDAADPAADLDGDGAFTLFDFLAYQNLFDAGCP